MTLRRSRFGPLEIAYDDAVLEPRPWTLEQSRWAAALLDDLPAGPVLELCAGAGQIGLVVAVETGRPLVQVDVDSRACTHARANAERAGVASDVRCGDLEEAVAAGERFPLVLADPPYIPSDEVDDLPGDPHAAIDGGADGLDVARTCVAVAAAHLVDGGLVLLQLKSVEQAELLRPVPADRGLEILEVRAVADAGALALLGAAVTSRSAGSA
jgi:methylase of polypeptide subunit release factors